MGKVIVIFLSLLLFPLKIVNSTEVYTIVRGGNDSNTDTNEHDKIILHSGCGKQAKDLEDLCKPFDAWKYISWSCTCRCKQGFSTFLLQEGKCVSNTFVHNSSDMGYGKKDCKYFVGYRSTNRPLTVVLTSKNHRITTVNGNYRNCSIKSIEYLADSEKLWQPFPTNHNVFAVNWTGQYKPPELLVNSTIDGFRQILGRIIKLTLKNCPDEQCALFKVAGRLTYHDLSGTTASVLETSTVLQFSTPSVVVHSSGSAFSVTTRCSLSLSTAVETKSPLFTSPTITAQQLSTRVIPTESHPDHDSSGTTASVLETSTVLQFSTPSVVVHSSGPAFSVTTQRSLSLSTTVEKKSPLFTSPTITAQQLSTRVIPSESHPGTKTSIPETVAPERSSAAAIPVSTEKVPTTSNPKFSGRRESNVGAAVGGGVAAVILLLALVLAVLCVLRKRKNRRTERPKSCPAMNNPAYVKDNSFNLEKCNTGSERDEEYLTPVHGELKKPYKSLVKKHPANNGGDDEDYTYATGDGLPSEQHYQGLVKEVKPNPAHSTKNKGQSAEPLYNVLEGPNATTENGSAPFSGSQAPSRPRYVNPSTLKKGTKSGSDKAPASTPLYDVLEGPNPESSQVSSQTPVYDILEGPDASSLTSQQTQGDHAKTGPPAQLGASQTPLYDVLEGPDSSCGESANKGSTGPGEQTYEALEPARESIYQPLDKDIDDYDNVYHSVT